MRDDRSVETTTWDLLTGPNFWDFWLGVAVGLCHVSAVPHLAASFASTGEFEADPTARSKTALRMILVASRLGLDHPDTKAALRRMNVGHRQVGLSEADMCYGLAVVAECPMWWAQNFGPHPWSATEVAATIAFYSRLGRHMGIRDFPADRAGLQQLIEDYERVHQSYSDIGARLVAAEISNVAGERKLLRVASRVGLAAILDDRTRSAIGLPRRSRTTRAIARTGLRTASRLLARRAPLIPPLGVGDTVRTTV